MKILCELIVLDEETNSIESKEGEELVEILNGLNDRNYKRLLDEKREEILINGKKVKEFKIKVDLKEFESKLTNLERREIELKNFKDKRIEILPLIVTKNVYILPVLATLSTILKELSGILKKEEIKDNKLKITFLIEKELIKYSKYIKNPFENHYGCIIDDIENCLPTLIDIDFYDMRSLLNLMLNRIISNSNLDISKDFILRQVNHEDLSEYFEKLHTRIRDESSTIKNLKNYIKEERERYPERVKGVIFNEEQEYSIIEKLLYILIDFEAVPQFILNNDT